MVFRKVGFVVVFLSLFISACKHTEATGSDFHSSVQSGRGAGGPPETSSSGPGSAAEQESEPSETDAAEPSSSTSKPELEIRSFAADPAVIDSGKSTILKWHVIGATSVSIEPGIGKVASSMLRIYPKESQSYTLTASDGSKSLRVEIPVQVLDNGGDWQVKESPPKLVKPAHINVRDVAFRSLGARDIHCGGKVYRILLDDDADAIVYMTGTKPLRHPVHIMGGRNVRVVGLHIDAETQQGCGIGELPNYPVKQHPNANIHPRLPGAMALRLQQSGTTFVEGVNIDVRGHQADCIVSRNPDDMDNTTARKIRNVTIQNSVCKGVEGMGKTPIGEGIHGDLFQNQGNDVLNRLVFENVSHRTSQEGIVIHGGGSDGIPGTRELVIRNYDYSWDPRYVGDDSYESFGLAFSGKPGNQWTLDNVRIEAYRDGGDYIMINGQRYGDSNHKNVERHPEIRSGLPPTGAFALESHTGVNYRSPHGQVPGQ